MTVLFAGGLGPESVLAPRALLRATFTGTVWAGVDKSENLRTAYNKLGNSLGGSGLGYLASPLAVAPGDQAMTVDVRRSSTGVPTAAAAASILTDLVGTLGPDKVELSRLALVPANEGSATAAAERETQTKVEAAKPGWWQDLLVKAQAVGQWFLWVLAAVAVVLLVYLFR